MHVMQASAVMNGYASIDFEAYAYDVDTPIMNLRPSVNNEACTPAIVGMHAYVDNRYTHVMQHANTCTSVCIHRCVLGSMHVTLPSFQS